MRQQCVSCGGIYAPTGPDGLEYYHACPPLSGPELRAALAAGTLIVPLALQGLLDAAKAADAARLPGDPSPSAVDRVLSTLTVPRPLARNENVTGPAPDEHSPAPIVSDGRGTRRVLGVDGPPVVTATAPARPPRSTP